MQYIKIPVINQNYRPMLKDNKLNAKIQEEFAYWLAEEMKRYLRDVVKKQRYKSHWKPLSPDYLKYKQLHGLSTNIWEASGFLIDHITVRKYRDHYIVGISRNLKYDVGGVSVYKVAVWMEHGTEKMPARPLFGPMYLYFRKNINFMFKKFIKEQGYSNIVP
jgi:hypothetical protein